MHAQTYISGTNSLTQLAFLMAAPPRNRSAGDHFAATNRNHKGADDEQESRYSDARAHVEGNWVATW